MQVHFNYNKRNEITEFSLKQHSIARVELLFFLFDFKQRYKRVEKQF